MRNSGEIRLFKLGSEASDVCIVFTEDYKAHVLRFTSDLSIGKAVIGMLFGNVCCYVDLNHDCGFADKYLSTVVTNCQDICLNKQKMMHEFHFRDEEVT
jgi:serine/threonine-protein kinase 19